MVLLHSIAAVAREFGYPVHVAHADHQLRPNSAEDCRFVEHHAQELQLRFHSARLDVRQVASDKAVSIEMAARELRHEFLARVAVEIDCKLIALAHHADDQLELFFLRLLRGTGSAGIAGMREISLSPADRRITLLRPFLTFTREKIARFAKDQQIAFREDASNSNIEVARNRVRHVLLPMLREQFSLREGAAIHRFMDLCGVESEFVTGQASEWLAKLNADSSPCPFESLHLAVRRRVMCLQLINLGVAPEFTLVEALCGHENRPITIPSGVRIQREKVGLLRLLPGMEKPFAAKEELRVELSDAGSVGFGGALIQWEVRARAGAFVPVCGAETFDKQSTGNCVTLRHWREGDVFQPIGASRAVKLQDLWTNAKVPRYERHRRVLAVDECGSIFWVEGLRISELHKIMSATRQELVWFWKPGADK